MYWRLFSKSLFVNYFFLKVDFRIIVTKRLILAMIIEVVKILILKLSTVIRESY